MWLILSKILSINGSERSESLGNTAGGSETENNNRRGRADLLLSALQENSRSQPEEKKMFFSFFSLLLLTYLEFCKQVHTEGLIKTGLEIVDRKKQRKNSFLSVF